MGRSEKICSIQVFGVDSDRWVRKRERVLQPDCSNRLVYRAERRKGE